MKVIFFGTSNFALPILEELNKHHQVLAVVTTPDAKAGRNQELAESSVSALAKELNIATFKPHDLKSTEFLEQIQKLKAEMFVAAAYGKILPESLISLPKLGTLNAHPSLLPKYRGASPIQTALLNGESRTGVSIILLDEQMDHGPILTQASLAIEPDDNFFTLSDKLSRLSAKLLINTLPEFGQGKIIPKPQDDSQASFTKIISRGDGKIDWQKFAHDIYNQFRAFYPWPGIWTTWDGKILKILDCAVHNPNDPNSIRMTRIESPGAILEGGIIACGGESLLQINTLQLEGKNETTINSFLNGYREFIGSLLQ